MLNVLLGLLAVVTAGFTSVFVKDYTKYRQKDSKRVKSGIVIGFITDFFDALGVGSFATTTAILKLNKKLNISDKLLPGTLNVGHSLPMIVQAFMSLTVIQVEMLTLISMIAAASIGSWIGAGIISKLPENKIQLTMGVALIITAILITLGQLGLISSGGDALELTGMMLIIGIIGNFILGSLMTVGIGLYAPCMAMVALLGMNPKAAFPIMMGSCAFVGPIASTKFVKEGAYEKNLSVGITLGGVVGSIIAIIFVSNLPVYWLKWLVVGVVLYTAITLLSSALKKDKKLYMDEAV